MGEKNRHIVNELLTIHIGVIERTRKMKKEMLENRKWKKRVMAFRAASIMTASAMMTLMPAVMASPTNDDAKSALYIVFAILFNFGLIIGIIMIGHGGMILVMGHAEQQSPEQARSIREVAAGATLLLLKFIIPVRTLVDFFNYFTKDSVK